MITLYGVGPGFGLPEVGPFVMKTEVQLKMSGVPYRKERGLPKDSPKGKIPFIEDGGRRIGDSTFIRAHVEATDLDRALSPQRRAQAWAIERMLEDHLYWGLLHIRWIHEENFARYGANLFDAAPEAMREALRTEALARTRNALHSHGLGRHSAAEIAALGDRSLAALAAQLGDKRYVMGDEPCAVDATAFAIYAGVQAPFFVSELTTRAGKYANLVAYRDRMMRQLYPEFAAAA
jgi:glutathione S-transferase